MARTISEIKEAIRLKKNDYSALSPILFKEEGGSAVGIYDNIADVTSININLAIKNQDFHFSITSAHSPTLSKDFFVVFTIIRLIEK